MKKISYLLTAACAIWGLTSCEADKDPVYHAPTEGSFSLYAPAMQDFYIDLAAGNTLELTTSGQPDYGYSAVANYTAQMALSNDFSNPEKVWDLIPIDEHQSKMQLKQEDIAQGVCELLGIDSADAYETMFPNGFTDMPLYFRAVCSLSGVEGSEIVSNAVSYNHITPYFAVATPGYIYLIGSPEGWNIDSPGPEWRLYEPADAIGSKIYSAVFDMPAGEIYWRFYLEAGNWGNDGEFPSFGPNPVDGDNTEVEFVDGSYAGKAVPGKGSWFIPDWAGGEITMVVDLSNENDINVTFSAGSVEVFVPSYIWAIGNQFGNWTEPSEDNASALEPYRLANSASAKSVYTGSFPVTAGDIYFRFAYELAGWDGGTQWGIQEEDSSIECTLSNGEFTGPYVNGKGSWQFSLPADGTLNLSVDTDSETITVDFVE